MRFGTISTTSNGLEEKEYGAAMSRPTRADELDHNLTD
jgi:hypothetical protein